MFPCPAATLESPAPSEPERQQEPGHGQQDASTPRKHHTQYRRFTESEATQTDPGRILTDALYQLQISWDFGMDVLNTLAEKARLQPSITRFYPPVLFVRIIIMRIDFMRIIWYYSSARRKTVCQ